MRPGVKVAGERAIIRVARPRQVLEGAGVPILRALPSRDIPYDEVDPFLLLDIFDASRAPGLGTAFPRHPHRGFEIITYILRGQAGHADDFGNSSVVRAGGLQRITAGRGMWHEEGPAPGGSEPAAGLQLWINLARKDKGIPPEYQALQPEEIPVRREDHTQVKVLVGEGSPTRLHTPALYLDVAMPPHASFGQELPAEFQGFVYLLQGQARFGANGAEAGEGQLLVLGPGEHLSVVTASQPVRFVLAAGLPHREPVRWNGPFVD